MADIIELLSIRLVRLNLDQNPFDLSSEDQSGTVETTYDIRTHKDDQDRFLMILEIKGGPDTKKGHAKLSVEAAGIAEFQVPSSLPPAQKYQAVAINGGSILYGLLRGQISLVTGSFPSGSILLPTLNWQDNVQAIERKRSAVQAEQEVYTSGKEQNEVPTKSTKAKQPKKRTNRKKATRKPGK